jgi:hypothetical protein
MSSTAQSSPRWSSEAQAVELEDDQSKDDRSRYKRAADARGCQTGPQTGRAIVEDAPPARAAQARTRRTKPPDRPAARPSSLRLPPDNSSESNRKLQRKRRVFQQNRPMSVVRRDDVDTRNPTSRRMSETDFSHQPALSPPSQASTIPVVHLASSVSKEPTGPCAGAMSVVGD